MPNHFPRKLPLPFLLRDQETLKFPVPWHRRNRAREASTNTLMYRAGHKGCSATDPTGAREKTGVSD